MMWRRANRTERIKAGAYDAAVILGMFLIGPALQSILGIFDQTSVLGLLCLMISLVLAFIAMCGVLGWWIGNHAAANWRSFGFRRYHLYRVYGTTGRQVGIGREILHMILSPIELPLLLVKTNADAVYAWARDIQIIHVPPGHPLPTGPLPRDNPHPFSPNPEYFND